VIAADKANARYPSMKPKRERDENGWQLISMAAAGMLSPPPSSFRLVVLAAEKAKSDFRKRRAHFLLAAPISGKKPDF
jgi:hypothetical protein